MDPWDLAFKIVTKRLVTRRKTPDLHNPDQDYLLRMIEDYLRNRWVVYEGAKWSFKEEMIRGSSQKSRIGLLVWNVMYDDFLRMDLLAGTSVIGFADDVLVVCAAEDVVILELRRVSGERMIEELFTTVNQNKPFVKFIAERYKSDETLPIFFIP